MAAIPSPESRFAETAPALKPADISAPGDRGAAPRTPPPDTLTQVELIWLEQRVEHWIRFGRDVAERILDRRRRVLSFAPGSIFAFVRWSSNVFGTVESRIDILRAVRPGEAFSTLPSVLPGAEILLRQAGWPKVEHVLQAIDAIEALGIDPADVAPEHWRHLHNRMTAGEAPRRYAQIQHAAWLKRRRIIA
jgi:hypothetical protein